MLTDKLTTIRCDYGCNPLPVRSRWANESELKAIEHLKSRLRSIGGDDTWILLTNLAFSVTHQLQSDEN